MTNHDMFAQAMQSLRGETRTTSEIRRAVLRAFPQFNSGSLLPNDHGNGNKGRCWCVGTKGQIFEPIQPALYRVLEFLESDRLSRERTCHVPKPARPAAAAPLTARSQALQGQALWERITKCLDDSDLPNWRDRIVRFEQVSAVKDRLNGRRWNDNEIFRGVLLAVLSNSVDWSRIEAVRPHLDQLFSDFSPVEYAKLSDEDIGRRVTWFTEHQAPLPRRGKHLKMLVGAAGQLCQLSREHGSLQRFLDGLLAKNGADPKLLAAALGGVGSGHKLAGLGIPLAAEALKNIGYDVAKPDRHVNRATGCFGMVEFPRWRDRDGRKAPPPNPADLMSVMQAMETLSREAQQTVTFVDNAVWLLCAKSGLRMSNADLTALATNISTTPL